MVDQITPDDPQLRAFPSPDDPVLRALVAQVLDERINEVFTRVRNVLETAGYTEAAEHVRRTFSE